jgi:hypothetical protein
MGSCNQTDTSDAVPRQTITEAFQGREPGTLILKDSPTTAQYGPFGLANRELKYRWGVRVSNIRKRIWLLLKHVAG